MVNERGMPDEIVKALRDFDRKGCEVLVQKSAGNAMALT